MRLALAALVLVPAIAEAQEIVLGTDTSSYTLYRAPSRWYAGGDIAYTMPRGEFRQNVKRGFGAQLHVLRGFDNAGFFGLRADGGLSAYGQRTLTYQYRRNCRACTYDVETSNSIVYFAIGPQLMMPGRRLTPYVNAGGGVTVFATASRFANAEDDSAFNLPDRFNISKNTGMLSWSSGAGLYIPLGKGRNPITLDLGARFYSGGVTSYLNRDSIVEAEDGTVSVTPKRSRTDFLLIQIGIAGKFGS